MNPPPFLVGQLLLSMPGIGDPRFERVVIAMCLHDEEGALGIVANSPMGELTVRGLMEQLDVDPGLTPAEARVMIGGPVEPGRGFVLHSPEYEGQSTISVAGPRGVNWALTSTLDILNDIAAEKGPRRWMAALGYTGWGAGQLDGEMTRHGWQTAPGDAGIVFETPVPLRWASAYEGLGIRSERLSAEAGRA